MNNTLNNITDNADFYSRINKICNFFLHCPASGLLFCAASDYRLITSVNQITRDRLAQEDFLIKTVKIDPGNFASFYTVLKQAADAHKGLIVYNLDEVILKAGDTFFSRINLLREDLLALDKPMLFWLSAENISRAANQAADFFLRRDRGVIYFPEVPETANKMEMLFAYPLEAGATASYEAVLLKIEILQNQLKEAEAKKYQPVRIAREIVLALIEQYLVLFMYPEAEALYNKYQKVITEAALPGADALIAALYFRIGKWDESLGLLLESLKLQKERGDTKKLAATYQQIGFIHSQKGEYDQADVYYHKSLDIAHTLDDKSLIAHIYLLVGMIHNDKGEYDQASAYYHKALDMSIALGNKSGIANTYHQIGMIHAAKGEYNQAIAYYQKSLKITTTLGIKIGMTNIYYQIANIYYQKGEYDQAYAYYQKSLEISTALGIKIGMAVTCNQLGLIYRNQGNYQSALEYILRAYSLFRFLNSPYIQKAYREILHLKPHFPEAEFNQQLLQSGINPAELTPAE